MPVILLRRALPAMLLAASCAIPWAHASGDELPSPAVHTPPVAEVAKTVSPPSELAAAFARAWPRQPEYRALATRRESAASLRASADSLIAAAPSAEVSARSGRDNAAREFEAGLALPLWLPGEKSRTARLADTAINGVEARFQLARLVFASRLREAWWAWQEARVNAELAHAQLASARALAADTARRAQAGEKSRADVYQAESAVALADSLRTDAERAVAMRASNYRALTGIPASELASNAAADTQAEIQPVSDVDLATLDTTHPQLLALAGEVEHARGSAALAELRRSEHPELLLATTRERGDASEAYRQTLTLGLRVPFGNNVRQHSLSRAAHADALEAEVRLERERERVHADIEAARTNLTLAAQGRDASAHRAQLAQDLRGFYAQAWQLGEVDLPTRLRIEQDAFEAGRAAARARFAHAAAISTLRQALGLLPE